MFWRPGQPPRRWEDGQLVERTLAAPDRWQVHSARRVLVTLGDIEFTVVQQPEGLTATKVGVGACLWDGALLLAAFLVAQPRHRLVGARCVELGAGVGAVGVAAAKLGARVVVTDIAKVLPLLEANLEANGLGAARARVAAPGAGAAEAEELEWGKEGWMRRVAALAADPPDLVLAADACYVDGDGASPSTPAFVQTCAGLCGPATRVLVSFERRSPEVRRCFLEEARRAFRRVELVPAASLPGPLRLPYCDLWELSGPVR